MDQGTDEHDDGKTDATQSSDATEPAPEAAPDPGPHAWRRRPWSMGVPVLVVATLVASALIVMSGNRDGATNDGEAAEGEDPEPTRPPGWETVDEPSDLQPLALSQGPLWGTDVGGPLAVLSEAVFRDDVAVLLGGQADGDSMDQIAVVDAATGTPRWSLDGLDELAGGDGAVLWSALDSPFGPHVVDQAGGWAVLVPYIYSPCPGWCHYTQVDRTEEYGVAALAADDGHVLWKTPVVPAEPMTDPPPETSTIRAMVTSEDLALVVVEPGGIQYAPSAQPYVDALRVVAIDPSSGSILWEVTGVRPEVIVGDTVLARTGDDPMRTRLGGEDQQEGPALVALDAATGRTRWDLSERFRYSDLVFTAGDVALVEVPADRADDAVGDVPVQGVETLVVDVATGREVTSLGTEAGLCRTDGTSLIACSFSMRGDDNRVATFTVDNRQKGVSAAGFDGLTIDAVWDGRVFVTAFDPPQPEIPEYPDPGELDPEEFDAAQEEYEEAWEEYESWLPVERRSSVDPSGRTVDATVPGDLLAASDDYVIFACGSIGNACDGEPESDDGTLDDRYAVYRLE